MWRSGEVSACDALTWVAARPSHLCQDDLPRTLNALGLFCEHGPLQDDLRDLLFAFAAWDTSGVLYGSVSHLVLLCACGPFASPACVM